MNPERVEALVLSTVRHSDKSDILTVYTPTHGRMAFVVAASAGKSARMRKARTMPLSLVEITFRAAPHAELHRATSITPLRVWNDIYFNPLKNAVAIFIAEFLSRLLRDMPPDELLFRYIANSLHVLDALKNGVANFHIAFLVGCGLFVGIFPDTETFVKGSVLDFRAGSFTTSVPMHNDWLTADESAYAALLSRINYLNMSRFRFTRQQRSQVVDLILRYYAIHLPGLGRLNSPQILAQLFG